MGNEFRAMAAGGPAAKRAPEMADILKTERPLTAQERINRRKAERVFAPLKVGDTVVASADNKKDWVVEEFLMVPGEVTTTRGRGKEALKPAVRVGRSFKDFKTITWEEYAQYNQATANEEAA